MKTDIRKNEKNFRKLIRLTRELDLIELWDVGTEYDLDKEQSLTEWLK